MSRPLSNDQKRYLSKDARRAWVKLGKPGTEDDFRRAQVKIACGANGLREACNNDYLTIKAHFEKLEGQTGKALNTELRRTQETRRQLMHNLAVWLDQGNLPLTYAESIARDRFSHGLNDCTDAELLQVVMTVKARVQAADPGVDHRGPAGARPKRRDKKKKPDPLDPSIRMPALDPETDRINADLAALSDLNAQLA